MAKKKAGAGATVESGPATEDLLATVERRLITAQQGADACSDYAQALANVQRARAFLVKQAREQATRG